MGKIKINLILISIVLFLFQCCNPVPDSEERGNAVSGKFTIFVDHSSYKLVKTLEEIYCTIYPEVEITIDTGHVNNLMSKLADSQISSAITCRKINEQDSIALHSRNIFFQQFHFATDAIVLIKNKSDTSKPESCFAEDLLNNCLQKKSYTIYTDNPASDNNYMLSKLLPDSKRCMSNWVNAERFENVYTIIKNNSNSMGIIAYSEISDSGDPKMKALRDSITVIPLNGLENTSTQYYPVQSAISEGEYPLQKPLYLITTEPFAGPASGFAAFVASEEGQRIIRMFGIQPVKVPTREVQITN